MPNFSGMWTLQAQMQAIAAGTWTGLPPRGLFSWGTNNVGQLGLNDIVNRSSPVQVGELTDWSILSCFNYSSFAIKTTGTLWSWGRNNVGQLGQNIAYNIDRSSPVQVGVLTDWSKVAAGDGFCASVKTDGTLWAWGANPFGQLGQNNLIYRSSPVQVGALTDWSKVSSGVAHCLAIKTNGTLWSWGVNTKGQLGQNTGAGVNRSSPVQVGSLTDWSQVSAGALFSVAVKTNGTLWTWGNNSFGQLGQNTGYGTDRSSPVQVGALTDWSQVIVGSRNGLAVKTNGTLWTWGYNGNGELGQNNRVELSSPVQVGALTNWSQLSGGYNFSRAIKTDGTLWSWGRNNTGNLGLNDVVNRSSPIQIGSLTNWSSISQGFGAKQSLAITS